MVCDGSVPFSLLLANEHLHSTGGVAPSLDFAILLQLDPTVSGDVSFRLSSFASPYAPSYAVDLGEAEAEVCCEANVSKGPAEAIRRFIGSPRSWILHYDGQTEIGALQGTNDQVLHSGNGLPPQTLISQPSVEDIEIDIC